MPGETEKIPSLPAETTDPSVAPLPVGVEGVGTDAAIIDGQGERVSDTYQTVSASLLPAGTLESLPVLTAGLLAPEPPHRVSVEDRWPSFLREEYLRRYLVSEDGKIKAVHMDVNRLYPSDTIRLLVEFKDENNLPAAELALFFFPDADSPGDYVGDSSRIDMFRRGNHYGFEIFVQAIRCLYSNPNITRKELTAVETGRHVWKHFDGFKLKPPYLEEAHERLKWLNRQYRLGLTDDAIERADTPYHLARLIDLQNPHPELLNLARETYRSSGWSEGKLLQQTRYPGELVLLALENRPQGDDDDVDYRYEATLDLRSEEDIKAFERSVDNFWRLKGLNPRASHKPHRRVKVYSHDAASGRPEEIWCTLKGDKPFFEAKRGLLDWDAFLYNGDEIQTGLWVNGRFLAPNEYAVINGSRRGETGQYVIHLDGRQIIGSVDTKRNHPEVIGDPEFILYPDTVQFVGRLWAVDSVTGKVSSTHIYRLSSLLPLVTDIGKFYNPATGILSFPEGTGLRPQKIDLNIQGLSEKCEITVEKPAERRHGYRLTFWWGTGRVLKVDFDSMENALHVSATGLNLRGFRFQYGRGTLASVASLKRIITDFMARVRWGYVPSYTGIPRGSSAAQPAGVELVRDADGPKPAEKKSGVEGPAGTGGNGGGGPVDPVERSRQVGHQLRSTLVAEMLPLPPLERKLDQGEILRLALTKDPAKNYVVPGVLRYDRLGDSYRLNKEKNIFEESGGGIRTWGDLLAFLETALQQAKEEERQIEVEIRQYEFPTLQPTPDFLAEAAKRALQYPKKSLTLVVKGDPRDPPALYRFDSEGVHASLLEVDEAALSFWNNGAGQGLFSRFLGANRVDRALFEAMTEAHREASDTSLGGYLARVIQLYNARAIGEILPLPEDRLTEIFSRLWDFRERVLEETKTALNWKPGEVPAGALYWDPISTLLRAHPADSSSKNGWFSIGAGQMVATLEFSRHLMDIGALPLDFQLMAVDPNESLVWEINEEGTNRVGLGTQRINEVDRRSIYALGGAQRDEALLTYRPDVVLFNLKASYLSRVVDDNLIRILRVIEAATGGPPKAYDEKGGLPYLDLYPRLHEAGLDLVVMGGFFAAPQILEGEKVDITLASASKGPLIRLARGMSPNTVSERGRADCDRLNLKLIANHELAAALMAGGANKNFLTYRSARGLMRWALDLPPHASEPEINSGDALLKREKDHNIEVGEEITARIVPVYGIYTDHLWSPRGLEEDFRNCLPPNMAGVHRIVATLRKILAPARIGPFHDRQTLVHLADGNVLGLGPIIRYYLEADPGVLTLGGDSLRRVEEQIRESILSETDRLIEEVRNGLGGGTRNARDGYIDEVIREVYETLRRNRYLPEGVSFRQFYQGHYPEKWKGTNAQEGRNGIGPLIQFAERHGITLPREVYEAWNLYHPEAPIEVREEQTRVVNLPEGVEINPVWGLSEQWVRRLRMGMSRLNMNLTDAVFEKRIPGNDFMKEGIGAMIHVINSVTADSGMRSEVTRRVLVIKDRLEILHRLFDGGHEPLGMPAAVWNDRLMKSAVVGFRQSVEDMITVLKGEESFTVTKLLTHLLRLAQKLYGVELDMRAETAIELGLADNGEMAEIGPVRPRAAPTLRTEPAVADSGASATTVVSSPDGGNEPKASSTGFDPVLSSGTFYAGIDQGSGVRGQGLTANNNLFYGATKLVVDGNTVREVTVDTAEETGDQRHETLRQGSGQARDQLARRSLDEGGGLVTSDPSASLRAGQGLVTEEDGEEATEDGETSVIESGLLPSAMTGLPSNVLLYPGVSPTTVVRTFARII